MFPNVPRFRAAILALMAACVVVFSLASIGSISKAEYAAYVPKPATTLPAGTTAPSMLVPTVTATDVDAIFNDVDMDGRADPGDTVEYTVTITNNGDDATGVKFATTLDGNETFVAGSLSASPLAGNDTYTATGNVQISVPDGATDLLANDISPLNGSNAGLTIASAPVTLSSMNCTGGCQQQRRHPGERQLYV